MSSSFILLKLLDQKEVGGTQIGGRGHSLTPTDPIDIPDHMASWSAHRSQGRREKGTVRVMVSVFPNHHCMRWTPAFLGMTEHLPANMKK